MGIKKLLKQLPFQLLVMIAVIALFGDYIPLIAQRYIFTVSIFIKELLIFFLPVVIFALVFNSIMQMTSGALKLIVSLFLGICALNFCATWFSFSISSLILKNLNLTVAASSSVEELTPIFHFDIGTLVKNEYALIAGIALGLFLLNYNIKLGQKLSKVLMKGANYFLSSIFVPLVPIFILGTMLQLKHEGVLLSIMKNYSGIILLIVGLNLAYLILFYFAANKFNFSKTISSIKNMLPAGLTGICTMSSAASLPIALEGSKKNTNGSKLADLALSAGINSHLAGDGIIVPILMIASLMSFGGDLMSSSQFLVFTGYYMILRFAGAAVPGGGILVILPTLDIVFGFSNEMLSVIYAIYVLCDSINACANVMGNGAFVIAFNNLFKPAATPVNEEKYEY